jgi:uncharacterized caspase-like protein
MGCQIKLGTIGRFVAATLGFIVAFALPSSSALADKRVALVIGNSAYQNVNRLPNPAKDAASIGDMLKKAGFNVVNAKQDVTNSDMRKMVRDFSDQARDADVAVVYYAGHGIEIDGTNYLLPVDTRLERDVDVEDEAVSLDRIVRILDPVKKLRLVILDACRDNPFQQTMKRSLSSRGVTRGLGKVEPENPNTLIAYAAKAGSTASDGDGEHSPFTTALLKQLPVPGQDLRKSLGYVRDDVMKQTSNKQEPFVYGSLGGDDVVLVAGAKPAPAAVPAQVSSLDPNSPLRRDYELAAQINTKAAWDAFLKNYPKGFYADLARAAQSKLSDSATPQVATATPEQRNLSAASPPGRAQPGAAAPATATAPAAGAPTRAPSINDYVGKSYRITLVQTEEQEAPNPGKVSRGNREAAIYIKSPAQITSRFNISPPPPGSPGRYSSAPLGGVDRGMQVTYGDGQLLLIMQASNYRVKFAVTAIGNSCSATVNFELQPGKTFFDMRSFSTGEPLTMRTVSADHVVCWVSPNDEVGPPPTPVAPSAQAPQAPAPAPAAKN